MYFIYSPLPLRGEWINWSVLGCVFFNLTLCCSGYWLDDSTTFSFVLSLPLSFFLSLSRSLSLLSLSLSLSFIGKMIEYSRVQTKSCKHCRRTQIPVRAYTHTQHRSPLQNVLNTKQSPDKREATWRTHTHPLSLSHSLAGLLLLACVVAALSFLA